MNQWSPWLARWTDAGLIDAATADRIREFEQADGGTSRLRWPILLALGFGALMVAGGVLLFVAAHWDMLSPTQRFVIVLFFVGGFHVGGAVSSDRFPAMSSALHAVGTVALGGGIALAGQIFNLEEHWPSGVMWWAIGAAVAWALLRQIPQFVLVAVLTPAWLQSEWIAALHERVDHDGARVLASASALLAVTYFAAVRQGRAPASRRALMWVGGIALLPACLVLAAATSAGFATGESPPKLVLAVGWAVALGGPLSLAFFLRGHEMWMNLGAAAWIVVIVWLDVVAGGIALYAWWAVGAIGLVAWGIRDGRSERVNMGAAIFAATIIAFYFSRVMDKLDRSASLMGFGLLFLVGGWALERVRRRLVRQARSVE